MMSTSSRRALLPLACVAFVSLGLPDGLLGVAWPSIRVQFNRDLDALGWLLAATTAGYVASSASSARLLASMNLGTLLALSCVATATSLVGYGWAGIWLLLLPLAVVAGVGAGAIDAGINTYVATHHPPRTVTWLHACYGLGAATGPMIMTMALALDVGWQRGYLLVGAGQLALAAAFARSARWWPPVSGDSAAGARGQHASVRLRDTLRVRAAVLGVFLFFLYTGFEAALGAWTYTLLTAGRAVAPMSAGSWVTVYWASLTAGRILAGLVGSVVPPGGMLRVCLIGIAVGAGLICSNVSHAFTLAGLVVAGTACGPVFPLLVATTPARVGRAHAANALGLQIAAAALGQSLVPAATGLAARWLGEPSIAGAYTVLAFTVLAVGARLILQTDARPRHGEEIRQPLAISQGSV